MKPYSLRPQAREDRRNQVRYYSKEAGAKVAASLVAALRKALQDLERQPRIGFPTLGLELGLDGMRTWTVDGFALSLWYFERENHVDVTRLIGQRKDASGIEVFEWHRWPVALPSRWRLTFWRCPIRGNRIFPAN